MELYRTYPSDLLKQAPAKMADSVTSGGSRTKSGLPGPPIPGPSGLQRRESTRAVKLPPKLEDDDPSAQLARAMDKCQQVLRTMKDTDIQAGGFFAEPVDPVKLGIPTYFQVIKEPMDLKTLTKKMDSGEVDCPEEFARLMRLIFENAVTFNIDPAHSVHRAARTLLAFFNKKYRDIDRVVQQIRKAQGVDDKGKKKKGKKVPEKPKTPRELRLEEAQTMATENAKALSAVMAAAASGSANVTRNEFSLLLKAVEQMQHQMVQTHTLLAGLFPGEDSAASATASAVPIVPVSSAVEVAPAPAPVERKKQAPKRKSEALKPEPVLIPDDSTPLTIEEQTLLTETINELDQEHLGGVIQIIREGLPGGADDEEIDLEIDQLDVKTQRKLLRHVTKYAKKPQTKTKKQRTSAQSKRKAQNAAKSKQNSESPAPAPAPAPKPKPTSDFFNFGKDDDSDSDSDDEPEPAVKPQNVAKPAGGGGGKQFKLDGDDEEEDEDDDDFDFGAGTSSWNVAKPETDSGKKEGDDDDAWGAAREAAAAGKVREAERKARERKIELEAENAKKQRLEDAAARGEEIKALRAEEEAKEAELREQQEREAEEARKAAREAARAQVQSVEQTVDLDAQRDIMKQYEQSFSGGDYGSASPSSDFGF